MTRPRKTPAQRIAARRLYELEQRELRKFMAERGYRLSSGVFVAVRR